MGLGGVSIPGADGIRVCCYICRLPGGQSGVVNGGDSGNDSGDCDSRCGGGFNLKIVSQEY